MYVSGILVDFESRLHQLCINQSILDSFIVEGDGYWYLVDAWVQDKWEREARLSKYRFTRSYIDLLTPLFNVNINILDETGDFILDETGDIILAG